MIHDSGFWIFLISLRANVLVEASEQNFALACCCGQNPKSGMATSENSRRSRIAHESSRISETLQVQAKFRLQQGFDFCCEKLIKIRAFVKQAVMRAAKFNAGSAAEF